MRYAISVPPGWARSDAAGRRNSRRGAGGGAPACGRTRNERAQPGRAAPRPLCDCSPGMAASEATTVDAGGRELRVSSPDRVIFPATERTAEVTKLDVVEYYLVGRGRHHARARAAADHARALAQGRAPGHRALHAREGRRRRLLPEARSRAARRTTWRRRGSSSRPAATPTRSAPPSWPWSAGRRRWARSPSTPGRCARDDVDHPDELRLDLDPQPGTDFADAVRVAAEARVLLDELGYAGFPKTSGGRGVHIYVRIEPRWTFTDVRHAAIAFGRELERRLPGQVTTKWWKEERGERIFVDYNQNARDRTIASAYSVRPKPGAPVSAPVTWDELAEVEPEDFTRRDDAGALRRGGRPPRRDRRRRPLARSRCSTCTSATSEGGRHALPARLPEDAGRAQARAALARPRPPALGEARCPTRSIFGSEPAALDPAGAALPPPRPTPQGGARASRRGHASDHAASTRSAKICARRLALRQLPGEHRDEALRAIASTRRKAARQSQRDPLTWWPAAVA